MLLVPRMLWQAYATLPEAVAWASVGLVILLVLFMMLKQQRSSNPTN